MPDTENGSLGEKKTTIPTKSKQTLLITLGILLIIVIFLLGYYFLARNKVVGGIPSELIFGQQIDSSDFNKSGFPNPNDVGVAQYDVVDNYSNLVKKYKDYFSKNGWRILGDTKFGTQYQIVGENQSKERINITIYTSVGEGTLEESKNLRVVVTYQQLPK